MNRIKITYEIIQLERLGKKLKKWTIRRHEKIGRIEISSLVYGPTSLINCEKKLKELNA